MEEKLTCAFCGEVLSEDTAYTFEGKLMCENCYNENTRTCENCGERIWNDEDEGDENITLCNHCREYHYTTCENCGRLIHNDDANYEDDDSDYPYCDECFRKIEEKAIKSYGYKPEPIFYGSGNLFMGVELEIDKGGEDDSNADVLLKTANSLSEHIYCKHDGSINDGFEIVSHPMTLDYHTNNMCWLDVMNKALQMNYRSHQTSTCGLHIHINRSALGKDHNDIEATIARIVHFVELHWNELLKFSRRTEDNINRWANRYGIATTAQDTYKNAKDKRMGRYVAVNLENYDTIEFRLFRGTLRHKTLLATLQLIDEICKRAIRLNDKVLEGMSWSDFVIGIPNDKVELIEYLKSKKLYVNDVVPELEEA